MDRLTHATERTLRTLVTGISGRVGSRLAAELLDRGHDVRGLAVPNDPMLARLTRTDELQIYFGDLRDSDRLLEATDNVDVVVHLAAQMVLDDSALELYEINVMGTMRLLEAVKNQEAPPRFVLASTDGTYGVTLPKYLPIDEQHPQVPGDYYSGSKVLAERLLENYAAQFGIPYVILRFSTVIAPEESLSWFRFESSLNRLRRAQLGKNTNLWPLFIEHSEMDQVLSGAVDDPSSNPAVALLGPTGEPWVMPITDVRDIVQAILQVIELREAPNDCFNIAGLPVTSEQGAKVIANALDLPLYQVKMPVRWSYNIETSKARAAFGFVPAWSFADTVRDALQLRGQEPSTTP